MSDGMIWRIGSGTGDEQCRNLERGIEHFAALHGNKLPTHIIVHPDDADALREVDVVEQIVGRWVLPHHVYLSSHHE